MLHIDQTTKYLARQSRNQNFNHEIHQTHERENCPRPPKAEAEAGAIATATNEVRGNHSNEHESGNLPFEKIRVDSRAKTAPA
jgi:hypothetical protein